MAALSEWLQIMLGEIARKRDDQERAHAEETQRASEAAQRTAEPRARGATLHRRSCGSSAGVDWEPVRLLVCIGRLRRVIHPH